MERRLRRDSCPSHFHESGLFSDVEAPRRQQRQKDQADQLADEWYRRAQLALEKGHVCVLNATALGTEVIKNLVLPGVGHFTLVDHQRVTGVVCCPVWCGLGCFRAFGLLVALMIAVAHVCHYIMGSLNEVWRW